MWYEELSYGVGVHEMLPASLESLKLYIYDDWSINGWGPELWAIGERKALEFPGLKIWIKYWLAGDEINEASPPFEAENISKRIEGFKERAREVGIDLQVRVDKKNKTRLD